jgi:nucleoside-diphosphate-sugar epimerase
MNETYFITGANGCIGSWIVKTLVDRGDTPIVFDLSDDTRRLDAIMDCDAVAAVRIVLGDVSDKASVVDALAESGARHVIHLAGLQVPTCRVDPVAGALVNVVGTLNVFEAARTTGVDRVVYASSAAVFGATYEATPIDESAPCEPSTHYGVFKRANEGNARVYAQDFGLSSVGLRPLTVYGVNRDTGLTSDPTKAMKSAVLGRRFHIRFGGATDFLYAADAAAAFVDSADNAPEGAFVFNLHGETVDVESLVRTVDDLLPTEQRGLITFGGPPIPIAPAMDDAAFRKTIGSTPATPLDVGVRETLERFAVLRDGGRLNTNDIDTAP